jgi:uncharacterized damage-inducible protein DinB
MNTLLADLDHEFRRHKKLADGTLAALDDAQFFHRPGPNVNPVALIVKHLAGNFRSRWTDFLTTDGEKPDRDRDAEFVVTEHDTRAALLTAWEHGWQTLFDTLGRLQASDLDRTVTIRGEPHTVRQSLLRGATHTAYHVGQIMYVVRLLRPDSRWLTVPPGGSRQHRAGYRQAP